MAHDKLGEDVGAVRACVGEVGHGDGILGADIAARAAIAAQRACRLRDAGGIDGVLEAHHHGSRDGRMAEGSARCLKRAVFGEFSCMSVACRAEHGGGPAKANIKQPVPGDLLRPDRVCEHAWIGLQGDAGIDEGPAAKPATDQHMDVGAEPEIEQSGARARAHLAAVQLKLAPEFRQPAREFPRQELLALLEHADPLARARKTRGGNAAAIAGADHHHVISRLDCARRRGKSLLHVP
jgi:hypothetical protein